MGDEEQLFTWKEDPAAPQTLTDLTVPESPNSEEIKAPTSTLSQLQVKF